MVVMTHVLVVGGVMSTHALAHELGAALTLVEYPPGHPILGESRYRRVVRVADDEPDLDLVAARVVTALGAERFDVMLCLHDDAVRLGARVAALLGLQFAAPVTADRTVSKHAMRTALGELNTVPFRLCARPGQIEDAAAALGTPVVVKPDAGRASRGVALLDTAEEVTAYAEQLRADGFLPEPMVVERRVSGQEFSVEGLSRAGRHEWLGLTRKVTAGAIEIGHVQPGLPADDPRYASIVGCVGNVLDRLGVHDGLTHTEVIVDADGAVHLVETHLRGGGDHILDLCGLRTGVDPTARFVRELLGCHLDDLPRSAPVPAAASRFLLPTRTGTVRAVEGLDQARRSPGVQFVVPLVGAGVHVDATVASNYGRAAAVVAVGDTAEEAMSRAEAALDHLTIRLDGDP
jgi:argininosuccinate lyase